MQSVSYIELTTLWNFKGRFPFTVAVVFCDGAFVPLLNGGRFVLLRSICSTSAHGVFMPRHKDADVAGMICEETVPSQCEHHCADTKAMETFISETHSGNPQCC